MKFNRLWKILIDQGMTKEDLRTKIGASPATIAKMGKGEKVSLDVIERVCELLNVQPGDIMEYVSKENSKDGD
jgi:DNA-binding Xre family transcriptional regulator